MDHYSTFSFVVSYYMPVHNEWTGGCHGDERITCSQQAGDGHLCGGIGHGFWGEVKC